MSKYKLDVRYKLEYRSLVCKSPFVLNYQSLYFFRLRENYQQFFCVRNSQRKLMCYATTNCSHNVIAHMWHMYRVMHEDSRVFYRWNGFCNVDVLSGDLRCS